MEEELEVWTLGTALEAVPHVRVGASLSRLGLADGRLWTQQATLGAELDLGVASLAAAVKSEPFGEDVDRLLAPAWAQLDARVGVGPLWAVGARLGVGWWNDSRGGLLRSPIDAGVGASWQLVPGLRLLAGVHHVRERVECSQSDVGCAGDLVHRDQGSYLDAGLVVALPIANLAMAVEDSRLLDASAPTTLVTLSLNAGL